jgi:hypothetical protein
MPFPLKIISFSLAAENDKGVKKTVTTFRAF